MSFVLACSKLWNPNLIQDLQEKTGFSFTLITKKEDLSLENLKELNPEKIFFPHWSYILKPEIYDQFQCVMFHMTDLPFGRGGSPLQNLIVRGLKQTKISAFVCDGGLDTGPVFMKKALGLEGRAQDIYERASGIIEEMIVEIIQKNPKPVPQKGDVVEFKRRKPEEGNLELAKDMEQVYDFIRMLDADGYPPAFLQLKNLKIDFSKAQFDGNEIKAEVKIYVEKK